MAEYPTFDYSKSDVRRTGKVIASETPWTTETEDTIRQAFVVANNSRGRYALRRSVSSRQAAFWRF